MQCGCVKLSAMTTRLLLYLAHAIDHLALLIFATAVSAIAMEFGIARWEDMMPYATGAFFLFGIGSIPAGRYGDLWGRRAMMLVFYFGMGVSLLIVAAAQSALQLAVALALMGAFSAIYHPVGIPMLLQHTKTPGATIGVNGLAGNLGIAIAALLTGFLVKNVGWRTAFVVPGVVCFMLGIAFAIVVPKETMSPSKRKGGALLNLDRKTVIRVFAVLMCTTIFSSMVFNLTTNGNGELLRERVARVANDPAQIGMVLAVIYAIASLAQIVVGRLIDRYAIKRVFLPVVFGQIICFSVAINATGTLFFIAALGYMIFVFGAIPFTDAIIARFVDDSMRSRVSGLRIGVSFGISSLAVWALGPLVKASGFATLITAMAVMAAATLIAVMFLPNTDPQSV
jgi:MFS family permease